MTQQAGRFTALTWPASLRPGGALWLRVLFGAANRIPAITTTLRRIEVIHFVRWSLLTRLPGGFRLNRPVLLFEGNFDGDLPAYIDIFAETVPKRFAGVWFSSYGYPGLIPPDGFFDWTKSLEASTGHYYSSYPGAATNTVGRALRLQESYHAFRARSAPLANDNEIVAAWQRFIEESQSWL